jgi:hypothetical protein
VHEPTMPTPLGIEAPAWRMSLWRGTSP